MTLIILGGLGRMVIKSELSSILSEKEKSRKKISVGVGMRDLKFSGNITYL